MNDIWTTIASERGALASDLADLSVEQWQTPSWCAGWSVEDLVAHLTATATATPASFFTGLAKNRFKFGDYVQAGIAGAKGDNPAQTLANFAAQRDARTAPPGPLPSWLGEVIIHGEDIRRPLGIAHDYPSDALVTVANFYQNSNMLIGAKKRISGLTLKAVDADWTHGTGPLVEGRLIDLIMAMTGRVEAVDSLSGDGVDALRARCS